MSYVHTKRLTAGDYVNYSLLGLISIISLFPFFYVLSISFTDPGAYVPFKFYLFPEKWSLYSYRYILSTNSFINSFKSTVFITVAGTVLNVLFTFTMAYGLTKKWVPGRNIFLGVVIVTLFFNAGVIPNYLVVKNMGLLNSYWSLIWPSLTNAWSLVVVKSFMESIHSELEDAAKIDGCSDLAVFWRIVIPLSMPAIAAFTLFFAVGHWNTYFNALIYISDTKKWTLQLLVKQLVIEGDASGVAQTLDNDAAPPVETIRMASIVLAMLPILVIYPFLQKYFAKGVMLGSIKG
ncbi:carbohydrate ABC transporter permease [Paenibacillus sp. TAB 01]|uniref:carbohydrate ABC transporter permease n=1 Tax=Paenibacillus sp. TAB 01 TaxID=3368988 RepID=UPI0037522036